MNILFVPNCHSSSYTNHSSDPSPPSTTDSTLPPSPPTSAKTPARFPPAWARRKVRIVVTSGSGFVDKLLVKACDYLKKKKKKKKNRVKFWKTRVEGSKRLEGRLRAVGSVNSDHSWCSAIVDWSVSLNRVTIPVDIVKWVIPKI